MSASVIPLPISNGTTSHGFVIIEYDRNLRHLFSQFELYMRYLLKKMTNVNVNAMRFTRSIIVT